MTALATTWAPGYINPGARPFENMPHDLELTGVSFAPEQLEFMNRAARFRPGWWEKMYALTLVAMPDPVFPHSEALGLPAITLDQDERGEPVLVPAVAEIDCSDWETFDEREPNWRRFPSVLGRITVYTSVTGSMLDGLGPIRLWNCWPIEEEDVELVKAATNQWMTDEWDPYITWLSVRDNYDETVCSAYESLFHLPDSMHRHEYDDRGYMVACVEGEAWFENYQADHMVADEVGDPYPVPFKPVGGLHHLTPAWEHLVSSSRSNTLGAMAAYPKWDRDDIARTERYYSPWLWSS